MCPHHLYYIEFLIQKKYFQMSEIQPANDFLYFSNRVLLMKKRKLFVYYNKPFSIQYFYIVNLPQCSTVEYHLYFSSRVVLLSLFLSLLQTLENGLSQHALTIDTLFLTPS